MEEKRFNDFHKFSMLYIATSNENNLRKLFSMNYIGLGDNKEEKAANSIHKWLSLINNVRKYYLREDFVPIVDIQYQYIEEYPYTKVKVSFKDKDTGEILNSKTVDKSAFSIFPNLKKEEPYRMIYDLLVEENIDIEAVIGLLINYTDPNSVEAYFNHPDPIDIHNTRFISAGKREYYPSKLNKSNSRYDSTKEGFRINRKPAMGMWAGPMNKDGTSDWIEWCIDEQFLVNNNKNRISFTLKEDANILMVNSPIDLLKIAYRYYGKCLSGIMNEYPSYSYIDYDEVCKDYDGIFINKYTVMMMRYAAIDLYSWDVESLCIWNDVVNRSSIEYHYSE